MDHNYKNVEKEIKNFQSDKSKPTENIEMASCVAYGEVITGTEHKMLKEKQVKFMRL